MKDKLEFLLDKAKLNLTKEEKEKYINDWKKFQEDLKLLDNFDLSNVEPLRQPFENEENSLRDDSIVNNIHEGILENASENKDDYILLKSNDKEDK